MDIKETTHIVTNIKEPMRLQEYGVGIFSNASTKSALKKAIKKGYITVNGLVATSGKIISANDKIKLSIPKKREIKRQFILDLDVIYEDDFFAAIHKPPGISVSGNTFKTITNALEQNLKPSTLQDSCTPKPIHRLDYATTGLLLVGKTNQSVILLGKLFENKQINKTYYAIAIGNMKDKGEINSKIEGKLSRSIYEVKNRVKSERFGTLNLVKLYPFTGRRHQLRKHLFGIGNPILGDRDYYIEGLLLKGKGMYLHAYSLEFTHPCTDQKIFLRDNQLKRFQKIFESFG